MSVIYLVRHGQASFGKEDYDLLSELGEQQATTLGNSLTKRLPADVMIFSGTMKRHHQTRDLAGLTETSNDVIEISDWNEYDHQEILRQFDSRMATAAGTKKALAEEKNPKEAFAQIFADATAKWQSGEYDQEYSETWIEFKRRVKNGLDTVIAKLQEEEKHTGVVFTSGGPISVIALQLLGLADERILAINWTLANCGVTKLVKTKNRLILSTLNDHGHFDYPELQHFITYK